MCIRDSLNLVQYAALAGDTRVADLAGQKAVDLAPKGERKQTRAEVEQAKLQAQSQAQGAQQQGGQPQGGATTP